MDGKVVIVTGANSGIGKETARELARMNAKVILACRNLEKGQAAVEDILQSVEDGRNVLLKQLDLASFNSIRAFVEDIKNTEGHVDILINNAGMIGTPTRQLTEDGLEVQFCTNHFGPFLLTNLLIPLLKKSPSARIIMVSSLAHRFASIDFRNMNAERRYDPTKIYASTKLANVLFALELSRRLEGTTIAVNALHPGIIGTELFRNISGWRRIVLLSSLPFVYPFLKTPAGGAKTSVHLASSSRVEGVTGRYFVDCKKRRPSRKARNANLASELWAVSEKITGYSADV